MKNNTKKKYKSSLRFSIFLGCVLFTVILGLTLSSINYFDHRRMVFDDARAYIRNVLNHTAGHIDVDDLAECIRTGERSPAYEKLQKDLDRIKDTMDLHYLYILIPLNTNETDNIQNVIAAMSSYEYEYQSENHVELNALAGTDYSPAEAKKYLDAYESGKPLTFFESITVRGDDYTGFMPLYDSNGSRVAALCMDLEISQMQSELRAHFLINFGLTVFFGTLFATVFLLWTRKNISKPIEEVAAGVTAFAEAERSGGKPIDLKMPTVKADNEIGTLVRSVEKLERDINSYIHDIQTAEQKLDRMTAEAYRDALTRVGNLAAFRQFSKDFNAKQRTEPTKFAIVMADTNHLKEINDSHGHKHGDDYLKNCCSAICDVYRHSPVFRIGGDEFVVVLTGRDFYDRKNLLETAKKWCADRKNDPEAKPWEKLSMALGMAESVGKPGDTVEAVLSRADKAMYRDKAQRP